MFNPWNIQSNYVPPPAPRAQFQNGRMVYPAQPPAYPMTANQWQGMPPLQFPQQQQQPQQANPFMPRPAAQLTPPAPPTQQAMPPQMPPMQANPGLAPQQPQQQRPPVPPWGMPGMGGMAPGAMPGLATNPLAALMAATQAAQTTQGYSMNPWQEYLNWMMQQQRALR